MMKKEDIEIGQYVLSYAGKTSLQTGICLIERNGKRKLALSLDGESHLLIALLAGEVAEGLEAEYGINSDSLPPVFPTDMLLNMMEVLNNDLEYISVRDLSPEGVYLTNIVVMTPEHTGEIEVPIEDALSLIARTGVPLLVKEHVFEQYEQRKRSHIHWYDLHEEEDFEQLRALSVEELAEYPEEELTIFLSKLTEREDYGTAARVREAVEMKNEK